MRRGRVGRRVGALDALPGPSRFERGERALATLATLAKADGGQLSAEGKRRLRVKRKAAAEITDEQLATFFEALADSCNRVVTA